MKTIVVSIASTFLLLSSFALLAQGNLAPSGAPAPSMKTLQQIEPRTDISKLSGDISSSYVITNPGSYYVSANIVTDGGKHGIQIKTNNVSIDLNGFTLSGLKTSGIAIYSTAHIENIRIFNGRLVDWARGISFYQAGIVTNAVVEDLQITGHSLTVGYGIQTGDGARISRCQVNGFTNAGVASISVGDNSLVTQCQLRKNSLGISVGSHSIVSDCSVRDASGSGTGIFAVSNCIIRNNDVYAAGQNGIRVTGTSLVTENNVSNCGTGIYAAGSDNRIDANQAHYSLYGIQTVSGSTNFVVRNFARGNSLSNYLLSTNLAGPIVTGIGTATNHPWANFSY